MRAGRILLACSTLLLPGPTPVRAQSCPLPIREQRDAIDAFRGLLPVLQHPRCSNCHGAVNVFVEDTPHEGGFMGDSTRTTDPFTFEETVQVRIPHPDRQRGICADCHDEAGGEWRQQTGGDVQWAGQPAAELCRRMKTTPILGVSNTPAGLLAHVRDDPLIRLGFVGRSGGAGFLRTCPGGPDCLPMSHADFLSGVAGWVNAVSEAGAWRGDPACGCVLEVEESVVLVVDVSGSMNSNGKLAAAQEAARSVIAEFLGSGASDPLAGGSGAAGGVPPVEFGILTYSGSCGSDFPFTPFSQDAVELGGVVDGLSAGGGTPMTPALYQARRRIWNEGSGKSGKIVLLTDGQNDCAGSAVEAAKRIFEKREDDVPVKPRTDAPGDLPAWWALLSPREALAAQVDGAVDAPRMSMPITVSTIGFQVDDRQQAELDAIATAGGGVSLRAENATQLAAAFRKAVSGPAIGGVGGGRGGARRPMPSASAIALVALGLTALGLIGALAVARTRLSASTSSAAPPAAPARPAPRIELVLEVVEPAGSPRRVAFRSAPLTIGRGSGNDLILDDAEASRRHARIVVAEGRLWIEDLGSSAGVFVDGRRVRRAEVRRGSEIRLGATRIRVA